MFDTNIIMFQYLLAVDKNHKNGFCKETLSKCQETMKRLALYSNLNRPYTKLTNKKHGLGVKHLMCKAMRFKSY